MTRRSLLKSAAMGGAAVAAGAMASTALADDEIQAMGGSVQADATITDGRYFGFSSEQPSFMTAPEPVAEADIVETLECDVLVAGAGLAGCAAARAAAENGLKVIVAEKTSTVQQRGAGAGTINSQLAQQFEDGAVESIDAAEFRWMQTCGNRPNERLVAQFMTRSGEAGDWLVEAGEAHGCTMSLWDGYSRNELLPDEPGYITMGAGEDNDLTLPNGSFVAADALHLEAIANGAEFLFDSPVVQLVQDEDGCVTGAIVETEEGYKQINSAKGVVLATGDIGGSEELCEYYCPVALTVPSVYTPVGGNTGDGHKMILWAGGTMQEAPFPTALHPQRWADRYSNQLEGPFLYVNEKGERFFNEGTWVQARSLQIMQNTADDCAWSIFDNSWPEDLKASLPYGGGMFWDMFRYKGESDYQTTVDYYANSLVEDDGYTYETADTLEELAEKIGVPTEQFLATVERYNELCKEGVDTDFCKNPALLYPIDEPPFHASKVGAVLLAVVGGATINTDFQCLTPDGDPIPGLYAIGNTSGGTYAVDYPINVPGNSHGRALTQGYLCGRKLAGVE
jgi:succinate dehydrogenase/fumarate reductase flavoprotein subunit